MENGKKLLENILATVVKVITNPAGFYREMPKKGGFVEPIIFVVAMALVAAAVNLVVVIFHIGSYSSMGFGMGVGIASAVGGLILVPIFGVIGSFIGAAILFVIWKIMGSQEDFETAYRCGAYAGAIAPITAILSLIPYIGGAIGLLWGFYLIIIASIEVHKIKPQTAWLVWGIIAAVLIIFSITAQFAARRFASQLAIKPYEMEKASKEMEKAAKEMEEAFKKMQEEMQKQQQK